MKVYMLVVVYFALLKIDYTHSVATDDCSNGNCNCPNGTLPNSANTECLPYVTVYGGECYENEQCQWLGSNYECRTKCICKTGFRWYKGTCRKYLNWDENCTTNEDCFDGIDPLALKCDAATKKCSCNAEYYHDKNRNDCRKMSGKDKICALTSDCQSPGLVCKVGKCIQVDFSYEIPSLQEKPTNSSPKFRNPEDTILDCNKPNTQEFKGLCTCKPGYFVNGNNCEAEIGFAECKTNEDCPIKPGKCISEMCYCRDYYVLSDDNRKCVKTISQENPNCLTLEWCSPWGPYSYCSSELQCKCSKVASLDIDENYCQYSGIPDPSLCRTEYDCNQFGMVCTDETCACAENYFNQNSTCVPKLGAPCNQDKSPCIWDASKCDDSKLCNCQEGYIQFDDMHCYQKRTKLDEACEVDEQCDIENSKCINKKCQCKEDCISNVAGLVDTCVKRKKLGEYCTKDIECTLSLSKNYQCRKQECQCQTGYQIVDGDCSSALLPIPANLLFGLIIFINAVRCLLR